jgi:hypothetical protein
MAILRVQGLGNKAGGDLVGAAAPGQGLAQSRLSRPLAFGLQASDLSLLGERFDSVLMKHRPIPAPGHIERQGRGGQSAGCDRDHDQAQIHADRPRP